jgi:hypothetical protein
MREKAGPLLYFARSERLQQTVEVCFRAVLMIFSRAHRTPSGRMARTENDAVSGALGSQKTSAAHDTPARFPRATATNLTIINANRAHAPAPL